MVGDVAASLWALNERLTDAHRKSVSAFADVRETLTQELEKEFADDRGFPMKPQRILSDLRREMRDDDILISDVGAHKMWMARHYPTYTPNTCIISNGFCSMGIALPGAIAAKLIHPERNAVGLCGDGGFMMNVQELATAVQYEVASVNLVWEDSEYGLIRWKQEAAYGKHSHIRFTNPDLVELARSFGCHAARVDSPDALRPALREAFGVTGRPSVIVVPVDYGENLKLTRRLGELLCH